MCICFMLCQLHVCHIAYFSGFRAHFTRPKNLCPFFVPMIDEKSARVIKEMHVSRGKSSHSKVALHFILLLIYFFIVK
jgi:hypothetical protein